MKPVFVDSVALLALGDKSDTLHTQAVRIRRELLQAKRKLVTTNAVILEMCNTLSEVDTRRTAIHLMDAVYQSPEIWELVHIDSQLMQKGIQLFKDRPDKEWSLVDCIGIEVSKEYKIEEIFTADRHFEQAGFTRLMKHPGES